MNLRDQLIKAGVESRLWENDDLDNAASTVESILDAMLDVLEANADGWISAAHRSGDLDDGMQRGDHALVDPLIAALRDVVGVEVDQ